MANSLHRCLRSHVWQLSVIGYISGPCTSRFGSKWSRYLAPLSHLVDHIWHSHLQVDTQNLPVRTGGGLLTQQLKLLAESASLPVSFNRVATNHKVREQVRLELSFVNSDLQMLKEELEGLNISVGVYQSTEETFTIPLIPLGLKETKDVDFSVVLKVNLKEMDTELTV